MPAQAMPYVMGCLAACLHACSRAVTARMGLHDAGQEGSSSPPCIRWQCLGPSAACILLLGCLQLPTQHGVLWLQGQDVGASSAWLCSAVAERA
jgi:hypothetical protein